MKAKMVVFRGILSVVAIFIYGWINFVLNSVGTIVSAKLSTLQFQNSDVAHVTSMIGMNFTQNLGIPALVLLLVLVWVWWGLLKELWSKKDAICGVFVLFTILSMAGSVFAYYDKYDYTEAYFILPNESAFFIPDVGANKDSQAKFGSEEYLRENKIAAKRYVIPHTKLPGSGVVTDFYVPAGRLIIVDRKPFNREWVKSASKGTSNKNEGFDVQSKEGLNISVGISIAASVFEEDSPRFLFRFGVKPPVGDRNKPEVVFTSVYQSYSLTEVMDSVVRNKVQALLGNEFTKRSFDQCNSEAEQIMASVQEKLDKYLKTVGITLDYVGWADTFEFDPEIQHAINRRFAAVQEEAIAKMLTPHLEAIKTLAFSDAIRSFGQKTDGKLPTNVSLWWLPTSLNDMIGSFFKGNTEKK
jgi:hypothetical protein